MRVTAIESIKDGICRSYGEGEYIGYREPNGGWMKDLGIKNPCIKLDSGKYVWGYQCWYDQFFNPHNYSIRRKVAYSIGNTP